MKDECSDYPSDYVDETTVSNTTVDGQRHKRKIKKLLNRSCMPLGSDFFEMHVIFALFDVPRALLKSNG